MDALRILGVLIRCRDDYRRPVIPLLITFSAGLLCGERIFLPRPLVGVMIGICLAGILLSIIRKHASAILPLVLFFFLGWFCMTGFAFPKIPDGHVTRFAGETCWTITGTIVEETAASSDRRIFFLKTRWLDDGRRHIRAAGNLRVTVYGAGPTLPHGARIRFQSRIREITNFKNPGAFDYKQYMTFQKVFGLAYTYVDRVDILSPADTPGWWPTIAAIRRNISGHIEESGRGVHIGILKALVIGQRTDLDPTVREVFSRAGISHLLAISGLHVGIVAGLMFFALVRLFAFIPALTWQGWVKKCAAVCTLPCVVAYGLIAGMSPSTQRAVIMTTVFLLALVAGRRHQLINTLALAALIILAVHPPSLHAVSFQLSFAAVFFILSGMTAVEDRLNRLENKWLKRGAGFMLVSLFAIVGASPLTAHYFNEVSWAGLFVNCLMIPLIGFVVVPLGLGGAVLCGISPSLSLLFFKAGGVILTVAYAIAETIAMRPNVAAKTITPNIFEMCGYFALLLALLTWIKHGFPLFARPQAEAAFKKPAVVKWATVVAVIAVIGLAVDAGYWINRRWFHDDLRITALDVGQGNAALVELPGGRCLLIDGGGFTGSTTFDVGKMIVAPFLWRHKIGTVDTLILTHSDTDHLGGLIYIADHFHVKRVWTTNEPVDTENYRRFVETIKKRRIAMPDFDRLDKNRVIDGVRFEIFYPPDDFMRLKERQTWRNPNNNSLVTRVSLGKISFLFPGDLMARAERELAIQAGERLASTVLMAPHHGSRTSSTAFFLSKVKPEAVVISAGRHNRFGCPNPDVLDRYAETGADIFRTDIDGAVVMSTRGKTLRLVTPMADKHQR